MNTPKNILLSEETLFRDEQVFTPSYMPEDFIHRDSQLKSLSINIKPGLRGLNTVNTLIYGPPGTGKTTAVKHIFNEIRKTSDKLLPVYVNCEDSDTQFSVFSRIHEAVFGHTPPDTGKPLESVKEKVFNKLNKTGKSIVVALDELDRLFLNKCADEVILDLLKSHSTYGYDKTGVIGIMIDDRHLAGLDMKTRSVYNPSKILFQPYSRQETYEILENRVKYGLYPNVASKQLLEYVVDKTMTQGDIRLGIQLLRKSAYLAEGDSSRTIKQTHVDAAFDGEYRVFALKQTLSSLTEDEKKLLKLLAESGETSSARIYGLFNTKTEISLKKYSEIVNKLEHYKMVDTSYSKGARGRSRNILLRYEPQDVLTLLENI